MKSLFALFLSGMTLTPLSALAAYSYWDIRCDLNTIKSSGAERFLEKIEIFDSFNNGFYRDLPIGLYATFRVRSAHGYIESTNYINSTAPYATQVVPHVNKEGVKTWIWIAKLNQVEDPMAVAHYISGFAIDTGVVVKKDFRTDMKTFIDKVVDMDSKQPQARNFLLPATIDFTSGAKLVTDTIRNQTERLDHPVHNYCYLDARIDWQIQD